MTIQQLQYFAALAETPNFSQVAREMHISQPNLSHAINALEQELGVQLFLRRKGRKTEVTADGKVFYHYVKNSLDILDEGVNAIRITEQTRQGQLRVAYSHVYGLVAAPAIVRELKRQYAPASAPVIRFTVVQSKTDFCKMIQDNEVDVAFSFSQGTGDVGMIPVETMPLKVIMSKNNPLSAKDVITVGDIADEPLICCDQEPYLHNHVLDIFRRHNMRPNIKEVFPDWGPQFASVSYNSGIAITPTILPFATDFIVTKEFSDPLNTLSYNCLYRSSANSKILRKLLRAAITFSEAEDTMH